MLIIGSHVSFNKDTQLLGSLKEALSYGANTFMFYTGAPQNTNRSPIESKLTLQAHHLMKEMNVDCSKVIVHAPYIINLANRYEESKYQFSLRFLKEEIIRCELLGIYSLVLHPGSHVKEGESSGIANVIAGLNDVLQKTAKEGNKVTILLETMAGKGSEVGKTFQEIHQIIDAVEDKNRIGVCLDTCHLNDAGYDLTDFDSILEEFDRIVGFSYLKCIHLNDSKNERGSKKDRHENFGFGSIGFDTLLSIAYHPRLREIPKILETPWIGENPPYKEEIEMIRSKKFDSTLKERLMITEKIT